MELEGKEEIPTQEYLKKLMQLEEEQEMLRQEYLKKSTELLKFFELNSCLIGEDLNIMAVYIARLWRREIYDDADIEKFFTLMKEVYENLEITPSSHSKQENKHGN